MTNLRPPLMATPRMAAGMLFRDERGHILMVKPTYKDGWDIPGGYVEPGESPAQASAREVREELGLTREPGALLVVDWAPAASEGDKVLFVFDGGLLSAADFANLSLDGQEIAEARFFPSEALLDVTPSRLARRLHLAVEAAAAGVTTYAEHGSELSSLAPPTTT